MNKCITAFRIEKMKLFRRSNILFIFLIAYLYLTPFSASLRELSKNESLGILYSSLMNNLSIISLLIMSLFFVNSIGNDFTEGSYRKSLVMGLERKEYIFGKVILIFIISVIIFTLNILIYYIIASYRTNIGIWGLTKVIPLIAPFNQIIALFCAGLFGLFIIVLFRNRVIGLVFFPFWFTIEFGAKLLEAKKNFPYTRFIPGNASFNLYNSSSFELANTIIVTSICLVFILSTWAGLEYREEKGQQLQ